MTSDPNARQEGGDHYKEAGYQWWDFADRVWPGCLEASALRYLVRLGKKGSRQAMRVDLGKALHYVEKILFEYQANGRVNIADRLDVDGWQKFAADNFEMYQTRHASAKTFAYQHAAAVLLVTWNSDMHLRMASSYIRLILAEEFPA